MSMLRRYRCPTFPSEESNRENSEPCKYLTFPLLRLSISLQEGPLKSLERFSQVAAKEEKLGSLRGSGPGVGSK
jgi:hypothetical protein